jgi:hypothetical protein
VIGRGCGGARLAGRGRRCARGMLGMRFRGRAVVCVRREYTTRTGNGERKETHRIALNALYSSPILSRLPLLLLCNPSARNAFNENSSSAISVASWSLPLSPSGFAIEACNTNMRMTYLTMPGTLSTRDQLERNSDQTRTTTKVARSRAQSCSTAPS